MQHITMSPETSTPNDSSESKLTELIKGDLPQKEPFRTLAIRFVGRLDDRLGEFTTAIRSSNFGLTAELAHWVKGTSGSVGLTQLSTLASQLEQASKESDVVEIATQYTSICEMIGRADEEFEMMT